MKDSYYFPHDSNARNDPKLKAVKKKYGIEGYGRYWVVIEMLRESSKYKLEYNDECIWNALAEEMKVDEKEVKQFIDDCIKIYKLFILDQNGYFYSEALLTRMVKLDTIRDKRKHAAEVRWKD